MQGKKIWITGAGSGIGKALALEFDKLGATLILSGRKKEALVTTKSLLRQKDECSILTIDLSKHDEIEKIFEANQSLLQKVDILVNNAGISQRSLVRETTFEVYKKLIDVNYLGTVRLSLLMLKSFDKKGHGHFVVITSTAGKFGVPFRSGYSGAKFALHGFFEALRAETKNKNIHITMVCPGFINTEISINSLSGDGSQHGVKDEAQKNGMPVDIMAQKTLKAIQSREEEFYVGGFRDAHLAPVVSRFFPSLFRKIIARSKVT